MRILTILILTLCFLNPRAQPCDTLKVESSISDSSFFTKSTLSFCEFSALVSKYQNVIDRGHLDSLNIHEKIVIIKLLNTIWWQEKFYNQFLYSHFYHTVSRTYLSKLLDDLEFVRKNRNYYSQRYNLWFESKEPEYPFRIII